MRIDVETLIQILFFVLIFGVAFIRFIYRSFVKPLADAEARRRKLAEGGGGEGSAEALRRLLADLRGEAPERPPGPARGEAAEARMEAPFGEARPAPPRPAPARVPAGPGGLGRPRPVAPGRAPREPAARRPGPPAKPSPQAPPARAPLEHRFRLEPEVEKGAVESPVAGGFASRPRPPGEPRAAPGEGGARIPRVGVSLRDAVVAQTVLGPPVCRLRRLRSGRRASVGRHGEEGRRHPPSGTERL